MTPDRNVTTIGDVIQAFAAATLARSDYRRAKLMLARARRWRSRAEVSRLESAVEILRARACELAAAANDLLPATSSLH